MSTKLVIAMVVLAACRYAPVSRSAATIQTTSQAISKSTGSAQNAVLYTADELDNLLAPIALFPDPLLAQMIPAATFVDQVRQASDWVRHGNKPENIDSQPWDLSVKAIAHYPHSLHMLSDNPDWATAIGQAYVAQPADVLASIQRLRVQAKNAGTLQSTPQQTVSEEQGSVTIEPAEPTMIYEPTYDPWYAYGPATIHPGLSFGAGLLIGAWLNRNVIWPDGGFRYHGWNGGGWIGRSRPYVDLQNSAYIDNRFNNITANRNVLNRNINTANLNRYNSVHRSTDWSNVESANIERANTARHGRTAAGNLAAGNLAGRPGTPGKPGARPGVKPLPRGPSTAARSAQHQSMSNRHHRTHPHSTHARSRHYGGGFHHVGRSRGGGFRGGGGRRR